MTWILLVSATQSLAARVPEVLTRPGVRVTVAGTRHGQLRRSSLIKDYVVLTEQPPDLPNALAEDPSILREPWDWILYDDDALIRALARGPLDDGLKAHVLPAGTQVGQQALGSKVGQQLLMEEAGAPTPTTRICRDLAEAERALADLDGPLCIKLDVGGGGAAVTRVRSSADIHRLLDRLPSMYAESAMRGDGVVLQRIVAGPLISIEPLYRRGELLGFLYSEILGTSPGPRGPSTARHFRAPYGDDIVESLQRLGRTGRLNGFGNVGAIWCPRKAKHLIFELDMRINAWVQFGPRLGQDWAELMRTDSLDRPRWQAADRVVHLYPRELEAASVRLNPQHALPWITRAPGTWDMRNHRDRAVNAAERRSLLRSAAFAPTRGAWLSLPRGARDRLEAAGLKSRALRIFGIHVAEPGRGPLAS